MADHGGAIALLHRKLSNIVNEQKLRTVLMVMYVGVGLVLLVVGIRTSP